jgi:hypothetical protein
VSLKSAIIIVCCSCVGWVSTTEAPLTCVAPISSAASQKKSSK